MKILQINASYKPAYIYGGPTMSVSKLSEQLLIAGESVTVFTTTANGAAELPLNNINPVLVDGVPVYYFKRITKDHSHLSPQLLKAVWQQAKQFDVIHIHAWWNLVSILSALIAVLRGVKLIVSPRGTLSNYSFHNKNSFIKKAIHHLLGKQVLNRATIHVTSPHEQVAINQLIQPKQIITIPNFINLPAHVPSNLTEQTGLLKILFLSRIEEKKGLDILLDALKQVIIPYHLTIAGDGDAVYIDKLKSLAEQNNISNHISWIGFQNNAKFEVLATHHLLILPSYDENFGNVVIESLSVGTAVLISDQVGLADYVMENNLGFICQTNATSVAEKINNTNRDDINKIRHTAPEIIYRDFNETNLVKLYQNMYQLCTS